MLILGAVFLLPPVAAWMHHVAHRWMAVLLTSFALAYGLTPLCIRLARHVKALDVPDERKTHGSATPLLGGLAVFPEGLPEAVGSDFNDLAAHAGADAVRAVVESAGMPSSSR